MNKLIKTIEFGVMKFKVAINREIALRCAEQFPDFFADIFEQSNNDRDIGSLIRNKQFRNMLEQSDKITSGCYEVVAFALPMMLEEASCDVNANEILDYAKENDADEVLSLNLWEVILLGFTNNGANKTPKIKFKMK